MNLNDMFMTIGVNNHPGWFRDIQLKYWPMDHQSAMLRKYVEHTRYGDFGDPGTGKTYPAQAHAILMAALGDNRACFVMPPKLIEQFHAELLEFFKGIEYKLSIGTLNETAAKKKKKMAEWDRTEWPKLLLLSYDIYRTLNDPSKTKSVGKNHWFLQDGTPFWNEDNLPVNPKADPYTKDGRIISSRGKAENPHRFKLYHSGYNVFFFDEGHALCGTDSILSKSVNQVSIELGEEVALYPMTGTPVPTHLENAYGLIRLINPAAYGSYAAFERQHCVVRKIKIQGRKGKTVSVPKIEGYRNVDKIHEALFANAQRVEKRSVVKLNDPLISQQRVRLAPAHKKVYDSIVNEHFLVAGDKVFAPETQSEVRALALRAISCPNEFDDKLSMDNEVAKAADQFLESVNPANHKVIIFAYHKPVIRFLSKRYEQWNPAVVFGESSGGSQVDKFKTDPTCRIAIINWVAGGAGLNLQMANHILFYECPTSPKDAKQAIARCDRKGQEKTVNVTFLRVMGTLSNKNFKSLLENEKSNNRVVRDTHDLLHELLGQGA